MRQEVDETCLRSQIGIAQTLRLMNPETISFEVPPDLLAALKVGSDDLKRQMRLMVAIAFFQEKKLSLGKAAQLAGLNHLSFIDALAQRAIVAFDYDESILDSELEGLGALPKLS